jgi:hypothetical protein
MQHESKIKRKKFEREKVSKPRTEIAPPQKAGQDPGPGLKEEAPPQHTIPETTISTETIETPADPVRSPEETSVPQALDTTPEPVQEQLSAPLGPIYEVVPPQTVPLTVEGPASPAHQRDEAYERPRQMVRDRRKKSEKKGFISRIKRLLGKG